MEANQSFNIRSLWTKVLIKQAKPVVEINASVPMWEPPPPYTFIRFYLLLTCWLKPGIVIFSPQRIISITRDL